MSNNFDPKRLIDLRKENFWTQEDLSAASGVSVRTIQRVETGMSGSMETWKSLAAALEKELIYFMITPTRPVYSKIEKKNAMFGVLIGSSGGLIGCAFGWLSFYQSADGILTAMTKRPLEGAIVVIATLFCLAVPVLTWKRMNSTHS